MNKIVLYTIWRRVDDLVLNPDFERVTFEEDHEVSVLLNDERYVQETVVENGVEIVKKYPEFIFDPNNRSKTRYEAIKCVDNLDVARTVCEASNGEFVYTYAEAFYGMSD